MLSPRPPALRRQWGPCQPGSQRGLTPHSPRRTSGAASGAGNCMSSQPSRCEGARHFISKQVFALSKASARARVGRKGLPRGVPAPQRFLPGQQELPQPSTPQPGPQNLPTFGSGREGKSRPLLTAPLPSSLPTLEELEADGPALACHRPRTFSRVKTPISWGTRGHEGTGPRSPSTSKVVCAQPLRTRLNGIPYFLRMMGEMRVILCRRKASQPWELPGKKPRAEKTSISLAGWGGACPAGRGGGAAGTPLSGQPFPPRPRGNETHRGLRDGVLGDEGRTHSTHPRSQTGCGCPETATHPELPPDKSHCIASTRSLGHVRAHPGHKTGELLLLTRHTVEWGPPPPPNTDESATRRGAA